MEPCWDGEAKWGVAHRDLTPGPHCLPAGLAMHYLSPVAPLPPEQPEPPAAESRRVQSCSERHLCKKNTIFFYRNGTWGWWRGGGQQCRHCCEAGLGSRSLSQSWGHIKSPGADTQPSPPSLVKVTHRINKAPAFSPTASPPSGTALSRPCLSVCGAP